ncbi:MAG: Glu/Leu/Phe/Val dehydrogenase [Candidatus Bathyarchaeota archaeon]|nr:Glu/Leu/Phe/Val dehydrogenase [Candidatus Bathyarchaeum tardum]WGM89757.1 MAG: Glu/Leu/Phe/Val dehydrogenase [Candidatus Bathyarchaeum tardum]WNZ30149.1 MAG: Glu/Leu/Phe/Val dehydrogenase [Candidatus Bathyarchaeota archaeon]
MANENSFEIARKQLNDCAKILKLDSDVYEILSHPMRELHVSIPVRMDNGKTKVFQGFRVQYNDALGPTKGGIRFHPEETVDTVRALAAWMTWKCSLLDLPLGGGKGGIICNPKEMSKNELERLSRSYIKSIWQFIGPQKDVPAPDVYTNSQTMAWMMDEYAKITGNNTFGCITGKPICVGGSCGRDDATARGGMYTIREAAKELGIDMKKATIAIHGYGNAGCYAALLSKEFFGANVVAVSDSKGGVYNKNGLDLDSICTCKAETCSVVNSPNTQTISGEELLELDVDILIAASLENIITAENASRIKAKVLAELANGPTTPEADEILYKNGVHLIPDFLCNAGGVTVSYFEMVQNASMYYWNLETIHERLATKMSKAYHEVLDSAKKYGVNMRQAAYVVAVNRVIEAMKIRGMI